MTNPLLDIAIVLILMLVNGFFAFSELAIISARRERLQPMAEAGEDGAKLALQMSDDPTALLSTVQVGITLVGILAGAFGGAALSARLSPLLADLPVVGPYSEAISFFIVVSIITYLSVVIGELVPKRLALQNPERAAAFVAPPMSVISRIAQPIVRVLAFSTDSILRLFGIDSRENVRLVTEDEIKLLVAQGAKAGVFDDAERDMVERIFRLGDRQLRSIMTPRTEVVWLDVNETTDEIRATVHDSSHTQFPVCEDSIDYVLGVVRSKDLLSYQWANDQIDLRAVSQPALFLPETMMVFRALELFKMQGTHMAILIDEFGGVEGVVTLIDILESIVGDIPTVDEMKEPPIVIREDGSMLIEGPISIDDLRLVLDLDDLPDDGNYQTLGGFVVFMMGRLPHAGESFNWSNLRFEVMDMDGNRVDKVLVQRISDIQE